MNEATVSWVKSGTYTSGRLIVTSDGMTFTPAKESDAITIPFTDIKYAKQSGARLFIKTNAARFHFDYSKDLSARANFINTSNPGGGISILSKVKQNYRRSSLDAHVQLLLDNKVNVVKSLFPLLDRELLTSRGANFISYVLPLSYSYVVILLAPIALIGSISRIGSQEFDVVATINIVLALTVALLSTVPYFVTKYDSNYRFMRLKLPIILFCLATVYTIIGFLTYGK